VNVIQGEANVADVARLSSSMALPLWRLYTLRLCYLILAGGLGIFIWPDVIKHTAEYAALRGIQVSLLAGLGATAVLGLRYPAKMIPLLLFELIWKTIYLVGFALPAWRSHQITDAMAADITSVLMVIVFVPLIPWRYVWRAYVTEQGEHWR
jgi:hypothetical protein